MRPGIDLTHKPAGPTSFSVVREYLARAQAEAPPGRRALRICHGGTLDPFASGLLLILVGPATRLFDHLHAIPKTYEATVRWGLETDNGDPLGRIIAEGDPSHLSARQLDEALLANFAGWREQTPHATSAKRVGGERAYVKAHRGETFDMLSSRVYLHEARWLEHDLPRRESRLRLTVRGGYYVRALARDLGRLVGCGAHLSMLHRVAIGPWTDPGPDRIVHVSGRDLLPWAPARLLNDQEVGDLRQGRAIRSTHSEAPDWPLPSGFPDPDAPTRGFHLGKLTFLLRRRDDGLHATTEFRGGL
jgi:tRNA pseudouridine55 synthase